MKTADLSTALPRIDPLAFSKNISTKGPQNRRSLGFARDDKGGVPVPSAIGCWCSGTAGPSASRPFLEMFFEKASGEICDFRLQDRK